MPSGIPTMPCHHRLDASIKFQERQQVATDPRGRQNGRHKRHRPISSPIAFLSQCSLASLVDIPPSRLSGIVVVNHFHLRVPNRRSVLPLGAHTRAHEANIDCASYLTGACKAQFCLDGNANPPTLASPSQAWYRISVVLAT